MKGACHSKSLIFSRRTGEVMKMDVLYRKGKAQFASGQNLGT